ncbi:hypothetical protein Oweho_1359 [Owenweeksia hongkongensis DSM 17368]|uniref:DUF72 domain-containing protein n=1 Tax=Owenweeksia hongkongensis (strain DSM 17368 / CIP 108786 / JCM 12287 / NRRL B-23963 / UST20020801) TaxID=926562 RepID=G8R7K3_OWEHD|nr:DUF72 domain-containing protein [Owenweeksia hongkongensis]AEV32356.1 hypothetical protein Oweho_1359 [Owenweeksia hongkongensis DSM 17368]
MKFGKVDDPSKIDFTLPPDHPETARVLKEKGDTSSKPEIFVGCAKWNRADLKGFYPRGTKDELEYYSTQFNSIELNATFYRPFGADQFKTWGEKTPADFKFFPKLNQEVSHWKRLNQAGDITRILVDNALALEEKLGMLFLQLRDDFKPKDIARMETFLKDFPKEAPLAVEVRNEEWFKEPVATEIYNMLEAYNATNIIVDTAGRRDMLHMRLTTPYAFVRYVGANVDSDYDRLDDWLDKLEPWIKQGIKGIYFFIHQNLEQASPLLAGHFIEGLNKRFGYDLKVPVKP